MADTQPTHIENWRPVPGYEGFYEVSDQGRVRTLDRYVRGRNDCRRLIKSRVLKTPPRSSGHPHVNLRRENVGKTRTVHSLVMEAFVGPRPEGMEVCHNDGNPANNHLSNLRYGTRSENCMDRVKHGVNFWVNHDRCPYGHLLEEPNLVPSVLYKQRACLACSRARGHRQTRKLPKSKHQRVSDWYYLDVMPPSETRFQ